MGGKLWPEEPEESGKQGIEGVAADDAIW